MSLPFATHAGMNQTVLLVDDDPGMIQLMGRMLAGHAHLRFATSGTGALQQLRQALPDLVLLDAEMPGMSGYAVCRAIKADPALAEVPVIFVTSHGDAAHEAEGLALGAVDFIVKPVSEPLLVARVRNQLDIRRLNDELRRNVRVDALTGLPDRRSFDEALEQQWKSAMRSGGPISLLRVSLDRSAPPAEAGPPDGPAGDDGSLRIVAKALQAAMLRPADTVARFGAREFAVLLPQTPGPGAELVARRVLDAIASLQATSGGAPSTHPPDAFVGAGCLEGSGPPRVRQGEQPRLLQAPAHAAVDLLRCADQALDRARADGASRGWRLDLDVGDGPGQGHAILPSAARTADPRATP